MESILRDARALDSSALSFKDVEGIYTTGTEGNRIVAIALIESDPRLATATVLTDAIAHSRSAFEQFHALSAAERALASLSAEDRVAVLQAVESVLDGRLEEATSDRRTVAQRILERSRR